MNRFSLSVMLLLSAIAAHAYDFEVDGIYYDITSQTEKTVAVTYVQLEVATPTYSGNLVIPETVRNKDISYSVTEIVDEAFANCTSLTDLTIPETVTTIGDYAFSGCYGLTKFTLPKSVTTIGQGAFYLCSALTEFVVDSENPAFTAQDSALYSKDAVTMVCCPASRDGEFTIPSTVERIEPYAFCGCEKLTKITIPNSVNSIGRASFFGCYSLTELYLPESVSSLGINVFCECSSLEHITVSADNKDFASQDGVLYNKDITTLVAYPAGREGAFTLPNGVTAIEYRAFCENAKIISVVLPETLTAISEWCFNACTSLQNVVIPNSVTSIGAGAFQNCTSLSELYLPESVSSLGINVFCECYSLECITVSADNKEFASRDGVLYNKDFTTLVAYPAGREGAFTLPNGVTAIEYGAFCENSKITSVVLPETLTAISEWCFNACTSLQKVVIPNSVTAIANYAFLGCKSLAEINLPEALTSLGVYAFGMCPSLKSITIPSGITSLSDAVFCYDTSLAEINLPPTLTAIGNFAFFGCESITNFVIPESVTTIDGYGAFACCTSLEKIYFPDRISYLGVETLWHCTSLTEVRLPSGLTSISSGLFYECSSLQSLEIPKTVTSICESGFENCSALESIDLPEAVTEIEKNAFSGCTSLDTVTGRNPVPPTVDDSNAFYGCNISAVYVPQESVTAYKDAPVWRDLNIVGVDLDGITNTAINITTSVHKCYDLKGMPVNSDTLTPGLYIIDGRKVLVR